MELNEQNKALLEAIYKRFDESERKITEELNNLKIVNEQLKVRVEDAERRLEHQNETILQLERRLNGNNLIIHGIDEVEESRLEENIIGLLKNKLGVELRTHDIQQVHRLGKVINPHKARPVKVNLTNYKAKAMIVRERTKLAGTSIYINEDLPKELRLRAAEERKSRNEVRGVKRFLNQSAGEVYEVGDSIIQDAKRRNENNVTNGEKK